MASRPSASPRLVVRVAEQVVQEFELETDTRIGSGQDNELSLSDPRVAHRHAMMQVEGSVHVLSAVDEADPIWVNGQRLAGKWQMRNGDRITIGDAELTYIEPPQSSDTGERLEDPQVDVSPPPSTSATPVDSRQSSRRPYIRASAGGILLLLAVFAAAGYFLMPGLVRESGPTPTPTPAALPTTPPGGSTVPATATAQVAQDTTPGPEEFDSQLDQSRALVEQSKFDEAIVIYQELARREPGDARPEVGWAWALILDWQPDQALVHGSRALEREPTSGNAMMVLSRAYLGTGEKGKAVELARNAVEAEGDNPMARAILAEAYLAGGSLPEAQEQLALGLAMEPEAAELRRVRGMLHLAVGETERAVAEFQAAADSEPELWIRQQELGRVLLENADYEAAIVPLKSALALRGKAATHSALGEAYYQLQELDRARSHLEQALSAGATDSSTYGLLSLILAQEGRCEDSRVYAEQALEGDTVHDRALEANSLCGLPEPPVETLPPTSATVEPAPTHTPAPVPPEPTQTGSVLKGRIVFPVWNEQTGQYDTYSARPDGTQRALVATEMHQPSFDPGGQWLALNGERHHSVNLFIARADGTEQTEITEHAEDGLPHWSPNGESLVYSSTQHGDKQSRIYVMDKVPFGGGKVAGRALLAGGFEVLGKYPYWIPDGRIIYSGCDYSVTPARCGLLLVDAEPGAAGPQAVTEHGGDSAPAASGGRIAFMSDRDGNWETYTVDLDGSGLRRLTDGPANDGLPTFSPDGKTIAYVSDRDGVWAMWAMQADGTGQRKLFDIGGGGLAFDWLDERISWSP